MFFNKVVGEFSMEGCVKPFGHNIGYIFLGGNVFNCETVVLLDLVLDPMVLDIHVARTLEVHDSPVCNVDRGLVVAEYELLVG